MWCHRDTRWRDVFFIRSRIWRFWVEKKPFCRFCGLCISVYAKYRKNNAKKKQQQKDLREYNQVWDNWIIIYSYIYLWLNKTIIKNYKVHVLYYVIYCTKCMLFSFLQTFRKVRLLVYLITRPHQIVLWQVYIIDYTILCTVKENGFFKQ